MASAPSDEEVFRRRQAEAERRLLKERVLRVYVTPEARQRLTNVRLVKPELAEVVEEMIIQLIARQKIKEPVTDEQVKMLLVEAQSRLEPKKEFKIRWT